MDAQAIPAQAITAQPLGAAWAERARAWLEPYAALPGGVTAPDGFLVGSAACGLKSRNPDVALLVAPEGAAAAGVFTTSRAAAAPVVLSREVVGRGRVGAVVTNAGNANACTGPQGLDDARRMQALAAEAAGVAPDAVAVCSTGIIGVPLPMAKVARGIAAAAAALDRGPAADARAALAITTTDAFPKQVAVRVDTPAGPVVLGGMAKGAGMIHPDMATMLAFLTTDAAVEAVDLQAALAGAVAGTFNSISVDGDTSTNDTALLLAGGASGVRLAPGEPGWDTFLSALEACCGVLALAIIADGEGSRRVLEVEVTGAAGAADARRAARAVAGSTLVKCALAGGDPNWGRLLAAAGASGAAMDLGRAGVWIEALPLFRDGAPVPFDREAVAAAMAAPWVRCRVDLGAGEARAVGWGCDLSDAYVRFNTRYHT